MTFYKLKINKFSSVTKIFASKIYNNDFFKENNCDVLGCFQTTILNEVKLVN